MLNIGLDYRTLFKSRKEATTLLLYFCIRHFRNRHKMLR
uniref:Uncharacterized protein n=1 Tax=Romanomermis culicivorax TaxID=13658 RepID=A0A915L265_ROMCU